MKVITRISGSLLLFVLLGFALASGSRPALASLDVTDCDIVVDPGGSIQAAVSASASNQTICVRGGVYEEQVRILAGKSGLTLIAYGDEQPIIDGDKRLPTSSPVEQTKALVEIGGEGTVFEGFEVRFSSARGIDITANDVTVRDTTVHDNWATGIIVFGGAAPLTGVLIENNDVYHNLRKTEHIPVVYRGLRAGSGATGWTFDPDVMWDNPFWSGAAADLPESSLNGLSITFNNDPTTNRLYVGSARASANRTGVIGAEYSAGGAPISYSGNDILFHTPNNNKWTLFFNGEDFQISAEWVIDAFQVERVPVESPPCSTCTPILMSFAGTVNLAMGGVVTPTVVGPGDLVRFSPATMKADGGVGTGAFSLYKTAADLGLPPGANIDALDRAPDGRLLVSLTADMQIGGLSVDKEDLAAFDEGTSAWSLFFDGDQIPFNPFGDDLTAAWLDQNGDIYISGDPVGGSALSFIKTEDSVARGNRVYNNYGEGLVAGRFSKNITLEDNVAYDNLHANIYLNSTDGPLVRRNLAYCTNDQRFWRKGSNDSYSPSPGIQIRDEAFANITPPPPVSTGQVVVNNIAIGCSNNFGVSTQREDNTGGLQNALIANNTFANARGETSLGINNVEFNGSASYTNSTFINNLVIQNTPGAILRVMGVSNMSSFTVANNLYSSNPPAGWFPNEPGRVVGNPRLTNPTPPLPTMGNEPDPAHYRLTYDSPAFDVGQANATITEDFFGASRALTGPPDIGAHELGYEGTIIIEQEALPAAVGQSFDFTTDYASGGFALRDGENAPSGPLPAGVYSVSSAPVAAWTTIASCDDGSQIDAIALSPGETVTCTFTSTRETRLVIANAPDPAVDPQLFDFTLAPGESFQLGNAERTFVVTPGVAHSIAAVVPAGWRQLSAACDNGAPVGSVTIGTGEWVTCTFAHEKLGRVVIRKVTVPPGTGQEFAFTADYDADGFTLADGQSNTSDLLAPGTYEVSELLPPGWAQSNATCDDGSTPAAIDLDPGETVTCTFTNSRTAPGPLATIYVTTAAAGSVRGLAYAQGDILAYDARVDTWSLYFDASDVGIVKPLGDFVLLEGGSILLTVNARVKLPTATGALFTLEVQDIARFVPTSLGATTTGSFEVYFDGSDVALSTSGEKIDALARRADGKLLISVTGSAAVKNGGTTIKAQDEDLLAFQPTSIGSNTAGTWSLAFDGSTLTGMAVEDVTAAWSAPVTNDLYLTVTNNFTVKGVAGTNRTVLAVTPGGAVSVYWNAADAGYPGLVDGLHIQR